MVSCVDLDHPSRIDRETVGAPLLSPRSGNVLIVLLRPDDALSVLLGHNKTPRGERCKTWPGLEIEMIKKDYRGTYIHLGSADCPKTARSGALLDLVERIPVPGATMSGFSRPSAVGPRELKPAIPSELSAILSRPIGGALNLGSPVSGSVNIGSPYVNARSGRKFSLAPTVMQFLAADCDPIIWMSVTPSAPAVAVGPEPVNKSTPALPAAKQMTMSGCSYTNLSISIADLLYPGSESPQESL
jgi:hypothetical protein